MWPPPPAGTSGRPTRQYGSPAEPGRRVGRHPFPRVPLSRQSQAPWEPESWSVVAEDGELVTKDEDLKVLGSIATGELGEALDGAAQTSGRQVVAHRVGLPRWETSGATLASRGRCELPGSRAVSEYLHPTGRPAASDPLEDAHHRDTENGFDARQQLGQAHRPAAARRDDHRWWVGK